MLALNLYVSYKKLWYSLYIAPFVLIIGITSIQPFIMDFKEVGV